VSTRGERLIEAMRVRGLNKQHALAFALGVNESTVTRWKHDGPMSLESAIALSQLLDISLDWFLVGSGAIDRRPDRSGAAIEDERLWSSLKRIGVVMTPRSKALLLAFMESMAPP
jgi:transcriptional regulator with XRE-family HTH domain